MVKRKTDTIINFILTKILFWGFLIGINFFYSLFLLIGLFGFGPNVNFDTFVWDIVRYYDSPYLGKFQLGLFISSFFLFIITQLFVFKNTKNTSTKIFAFFDFYFLAIFVGLLMLYGAIN